MPRWPLGRPGLSAGAPASQAPRSGTARALVARARPVPAPTLTSARVAERPCDARGVSTRGHGGFTALATSCVRPRLLDYPLLGGHRPMVTTRIASGTAKAARKAG